MQGPGVLPPPSRAEAETAAQPVAASSQIVAAPSEIATGQIQAAAEASGGHPAARRRLHKAVSFTAAPDHPENMTRPPSPTSPASKLPAFTPSLNKAPSSSPRSSPSSSTSAAAEESASPAPSQGAALQSLVGSGGEAVRQLPFPISSSQSSGVKPRHCRCRRTILRRSATS